MIVTINGEISKLGLIIRKGINKLKAARWLKTIEGNRKLALDVRFIGEIESWMVEIMGADRMIYCKACRKLVVRGVYCDNCDAVAWHHYCVEKQVTKGVDVRGQECDIKVRKGQGAGERCGSRSEASPRQEKEETRGDTSKKRRSSVIEECEENAQVVNSAGRIKRRFSDSESD